MGSINTIESVVESSSTCNKEVESSSTCDKEMESSSTCDKNTESSSTCIICMDSFKSYEVVFKICGGTECEKYGFCKSCLQQHFESIISSGFDGSCPRMKCPGCVRRIVRRPTWEEFVSAEMTKLFQERASKLLSLQCGSCHSRRSIFLETPVFESKEALKIDTKEKISQLLLILKNLHKKEIAINEKKEEQDVSEKKDEEESDLLEANETLSEILRKLQQFELNEINERECFDLLDRILNINDGEEGFERFKVVLRIILDEERRAMLHLRYLSFHPKVKSLCCSYVHCFWCKIKQFHDGKTCMEYLASKNKMEDILFCPSCSLALVKGDGCNSIKCLCGKSFSWETEVRKQKSAAFTGEFGNKSTLKAIEILKLGTVEVDEVVRSRAEIYSSLNNGEMKKGIREFWENQFRPYAVEASINFSTLLQTSNFRSKWPKPEIFNEFVSEWNTSNQDKIDVIKNNYNNLKSKYFEMFYDDALNMTLLLRHLPEYKQIINLISDLQFDEYEKQLLFLIKEANDIVVKKSEQFTALYGMGVLSKKVINYLEKTIFSEEELQRAINKAIIFNYEAELIPLSHKPLLEAFNTVNSTKICIAQQNRLIRGESAWLSKYNNCQETAFKALHDTDDLNITLSDAFCFKLRNNEFCAILETEMCFENLPQLFGTDNYDY